MMDLLRTRITGEEFDYLILMDVLKDYAYPRDKVTELLRKELIVRIKKGIYVFGKTFSRGALSREILANMIYGPSCVSLDYALHFHGLIPERVEAITSVTPNRARKFRTPLGMFIYRTVPLAGYAAGIDRNEMDSGRGFLIATPEKALADKIWEDRGFDIRTRQELRTYLFENLRIDPAVMSKLNPVSVEFLACHYQSRKIALLANLLKEKSAESKG